MVIALNVRRNRPQSSIFALNVRTSKNIRGSCRSRSGRCQGANGNSSYIFSNEEYTVVIKYSQVGKWCRTLGAHFLTRMFDTRLTYAQFASNIQVNYQEMRTEGTK